MPEQTEETGQRREKGEREARKFNFYFHFDYPAEVDKVVKYFHISYEVQDSLEWPL